MDKITKIDFHTHIFPDKVAEMAIPKLAKQANIPAYSDGTVSGLLKRMEENGVSVSVGLCIATNRKQQASVINFQKEINGDKIVAFGSVYPHAEDALDFLEIIWESGLKGIKLHPEFQSFDVLDKKMFPIYEYCQSKDLITVFHSGIDFDYMGSCHGKPSDFGKLARLFPRLRMVCAHMGGFQMWDEVYESLAGADNVWLDTAFTYGYMPPEKFYSILGRHGDDRILFATDSPWSHAGRETRFIESLDLSDETKEKIYYKNAVRLLKL